LSDSTRESNPGLLITRRTLKPQDHAPVFVTVFLAQLYPGWIAIAKQD